MIGYVLFLKKIKELLFQKKVILVTPILKLNYLKLLETREQLVLIDDDNDGLKDIILYQDSELID